MTFPILPTEGRAFANALNDKRESLDEIYEGDEMYEALNVCLGNREPDPMDVAEALLLAAMDIRSSGETIMACRSAHPQAIADARAAVRTITEQLDWMEGRNV